MEALPYLQAAGTIFQAIGTLQRGQAAKAAGRYNAEVAERNAATARRQAAMDAETQKRESDKRLGAIVAGYGASGVTLEGSPLDVLASSASEAERDRQTILYKGELRAMGYEADAEIERFSGDNAARASYTKAGSELLIGGAKAYGMTGK